MQKKTTPPPTDEDIMAYSNVPVDVAASYIGWSTPTVYAALQDDRAPFGFAVQSQKTKTWAYNISPGLLVKYHRGDLPTYRLKEVQYLITEGVEALLAAKMDGLNKVLGAVVGA